MPVFIISLVPLNFLLPLVIYSAGLFLSFYLNIWRICYPNEGLKLFRLLLRCGRLIYVELIESTLVVWKGNLSHALTQFFVPFNCTCSQLIILFNIEIGFISGICFLKNFYICIYHLPFHLAKHFSFPYPIAYISCIALWAHVKWFYSFVKIASRHFGGESVPWWKKETKTLLWDIPCLTQLSPFYFGSLVCS